MAMGTQTKNFKKTKNKKKCLENYPSGTFLHHNKIQACVKFLK